MKYKNNTFPIWLALPVLLLLSQAAGAATCTTLSAGNWNTAGRWSCGHVPNNTDDVVIAHDITMNVNPTIISLTVNAGSTLSDDGNNRTLTITGNVTVQGTITDNGGRVSMDITGAAAVISGAGAISNDVRVYTSGTSVTIAAGSSLTFSGASRFYAGRTAGGTTVAGSVLTIDGTLNSTVASGTTTFLRLYGNSTVIGPTGSINAATSAISFNTASTTVTNNGSVTVESVTQNAASNSWTQGANSSLTLSAPSTVGTFNAHANGNTVTYNGTATVIPPAAGYWNLAGTIFPAACPVAYTILGSDPCVGAPIVTTNAATAITTTGATLNGTVSDNGAATTVTFQYGIGAYDHTVTATQSPLAAGSGSVVVSASISGLPCGTTYDFRVVGTNSYGTSYGGNPTFTTAACPTGLGVTASPTACVNDAGIGSVNWGTLAGPLISENISATASVDGQISRYLKCTGYGFAIPAGATIAGITVNVERRSDRTANGGSMDAAMRLVRADVIQATDRATGTIYTTADFVEAHGGAADLWGGAWTASDINLATFGAAFAATKPSNNGQAHIVSVDHMPITVYYTPSTPWVASINRTSANPTAANTTVTWDVLFSGNASGVDVSDFQLVMSGSVTGATIISVTGSGRVRTVTANTGSGATGTLGLNLLDDDTITIGGVPLGGAGADNGNFTGQVYTLEVPVCSGTFIYCDDFERSNPGSVGNGWTVTPGPGADCAGVAGNSGCAGIDTDIPPFNATTNRANTTRSMFTRWSIVSVDSPTIDLSGHPSALLSFWMRRGGDAFSEYPEAVGEDYLVRYLASDNTWKVLAQYPTGVMQGQVFTPVIQLPPDAMHANFRLRYYQPAGSGDANGGATGGAPGVVGYDYWHIDDVIIREAPVSSYVGAFCDNFEAGLARWSISAEGAPVTAAIGDALLGTTDFNSAGHELDMRWGYVTVSTLRTDMTGVNGDIVYWLKSGTSAARDPDANEDLVVEYFTDAGTWATLATYLGSAPAGTVFNGTHPIPPAAQHAGFRLRFRQLNGSAFDNDYWHVDDVCVGTPPPNADLALTKTRSGPLVPGANGTYTLAVTNNGPEAMAGTIQIVDTLPAFLSYSSASGTGWTCTWNAPDVTCSYVGTLNVGATAPAVTLVTAVDANAVGTIINTATVTGTSIDANTANNTATDSYTIFTANLLAQYRLEEATWNGTSGEVKDTGGYPGGPFNGTAVGTPYPASSLTNPAQAGSPGTCGYGNMPGPAAGGGAFNITGLPVSLAVDDSTSIAFWMYWDGTDNVMPLGWGSQALLLQGGNFGFHTANSDIYGISSATLATGWHHVVAVFTNGSVANNQLYIDGAIQTLTQRAGTPNLANATVGSALSLGGWMLNGNHRFAGRLDEVVIYQGALTQSEVTALYTATHTCAPAVDHYELSLPSSSISCLATTVTVIACSNNSSPCTSPATTINGQTATLSTTAGTLGTTTVTFDAGGIASTSLSYPALATDGTDVTVTLSGETIGAANARQCCPDGGACEARDNCTTTFNTAGFIFSNAADGAGTNIATQVAGTSSGTYYLRAVRTNTTTQACEAGLNGANVPVDFAYECNNPTTCYSSNLMSINGGTATTIARNDNGGGMFGYSYTPVNMTFDANGNAPFTLNYSDVGQVRLLTRKTLTASGSITAATLSGSTNAFVVRPGGFVLSGIQRTALPLLANPAAADAAGARFVRAGEPFSATVTAVTSTGSTAYNYGRETTPEGVRLISALVTGLGLTHDPGVTNSTAFGTFSNGVATGTTFAWNEAGIITLTPAVGDANYLGAGDVTGTTSGNVGRFYAAQFGLSAGAIVNRADLCPAAAGCPSAFTYMDEQMNAQFTLTAQAMDGTRLQNYVGGFAKFDPTAGALNLDAINDPLGTRVPLGARISTAGLPAVSGQFLSTCAPSPACLGTANVVAPFMITRGAAADGPYAALTVGVAPADSDGAILLYDVDTQNVVAGANNHGTVGSTETRFGRIKVSSAYGSERLPLRISAATQFWDGTTWLTSTTDSVTSFDTSALTTSNFTLPLAAGNISVVGAGPVTVNNGVRAFTLAAPGVTGSADIGLSDPSYLPSATGRVTFGVYKNPNSYIYRREN